MPCKEKFSKQLLRPFVSKSLIDSGWMSYYKRKPKVEGDFDYYKIVFYLEKKAQLQEKVTEKVTENQRQILKAIEKNPHITAPELSGILGISERKTKENIKKLKEKALLKRIG